MRGSWMVAGCVALALAACSGSNSSVTSAPSQTASATDVAPAESIEPAEPTTTAASAESSTSSASTVALPAGAPVCAPAADLAAATTVTRTITVGAEQREYLVRLPATVATGPMPLVVDFHGAGSDMQQQAFYSGFDAVADREGFVVATPNGIDPTRRQWRFLGPDDLEFARSLVDQLAGDACVDRERVFAAGISSGSAMSASLACRASDVFRGFGLVAANAYQPALCDGATPRPMVIFHGTDDSVVPYEGGGVNTADGFSVDPAEDVAAAWADHHGCEPTPTETPVGSEVVRFDWSGCAAPISFYRIEGGGHTWPGAEVSVFWLGATTDQIDATELMWAAFEAA